jgi:adenylate kinase family enzyme
VTDYQRILVAGVSGSGKSTLARRIAAKGYPYTELDSLHHGEGWTRRPEFEADVRAIAAGERWVSEWQYRDVRPLLAARADLIVWLDLPTRVTMARVIRRTIRRSVTREVLWNGNREPGLWHALTSNDGIIRWAWNTRKNYRETVPRAGVETVRLRSSREVEAWLVAFA